MKLTKLEHQTEAGELEKQYSGKPANLPTPRVILVSCIVDNRQKASAYLHTTKDELDARVASVKFPAYKFDEGQKKVLKKAESALKNMKGLPPEIPFHWSS